jgi:predicted nucleic acid-binding protein
MYILDTNAAYYLPDPAWTTPARLARIQERAEAGDLEFGLSPITVLELASRVAEEPNWFDRVREAARTLVSLRPKSLPDPEQRMREIMEDVDLARQSYAQWPAGLETIASAPDVHALQTGFRDWTTATRRSVNVLELREYRDEYERQYIIDMGDLVHAFNPAYEDQVRRGVQTRLERDEQASFEVFLGASEWTDVFLAMMAHRGTVGSGIPQDAAKVAVALRKAKYFKLGFEQLTRSMFIDGARPNLRRANDYNDIHQLLYVSEFTGDILVSEDAGVLARVGAADGKVISFRQFLELEAD